MQQTIQVAVSTTTNEGQSTVAMANDGRFAIGYAVDYNGNAADTDIYLKRYNASGSLRNTHSIAPSVNDADSPDVAMDNNGNTVVTWQEAVHGNWDVMFRLVDSNGTESLIKQVSKTAMHETAPVVAMNRSTGAFVVGYRADNQIYVTEFSRSGIFRNEYFVGLGHSISISSAMSNGAYLLSFNSNRGITGRRGNV